MTGSCDDLRSTPLHRESPRLRHPVAAAVRPKPPCRMDPRLRVVPPPLAGLRRESSTGSGTTRARGCADGFPPPPIGVPHPQIPPSPPQDPAVLHRQRCPSCGEVVRTGAWSSRCRCARRTPSLSVRSPTVRAMSTKARTRPSYRCSECGWETVKWVGRCGECQAWGSVAEAGAPTLRAAAGPVSTPAVPIGQVAITESRRAVQRRARARPRARRRARARCRDPARRRARRRQEHPAAGGRGADRPHPPAHPLRHRRGVGRPGAAPRRAHRRRPGRAVPRRGDRPRCGADPHRGGPARRCWWSTRCRPSAPPASRACPAASPR